MNGENLKATKNALQLVDLLGEGAKPETPEKVFTKEQVIEVLLAEFKYWEQNDSIDAIGALSNVIAWFAVDDFRADWHPEKPKNKS